jgi:hypothetical protein
MAAVVCCRCWRPSSGSARRRHLLPSRHSSSARRSDGLIGRASSWSCHGGFACANHLGAFAGVSASRLPATWRSSGTWGEALSAMATGTVENYLSLPALQR